MSPAQKLIMTYLGLSTGDRKEFDGYYAKRKFIREIKRWLAGLSPAQTRALDGCLTLDTFASRVESAYRARTEEELSVLVEGESRFVPGCSSAA